MQSSPNSPDFKIGQRVHSAGDCRRIGTVKYVGAVEGYSGNWVGIDWDNDGDGKHDGSINGVRYFQAKSPNSASFVRPQNLSSGITLLQALELRYRSISTKEEEGIYCISVDINIYMLFEHYTSELIFTKTELVCLFGVWGYCGFEKSKKIRTSYV